MSTSYSAKVIVGFEAKSSELALSKRPNWTCPKGHLRNVKEDKFCPKCGGTFTKGPKPPPTLIEQYAQKIDRDPKELFEDWHEAYGDDETMLRAAGEKTVLGQVLAKVNDYSTIGVTLDPEKQARITAGLEKIRADLGWEDRPIKAHLVLEWG